MAIMVNVIELGFTEITHDGRTIKLPNELILFAADEIRSQCIGKKPVIPQPQPGRRDIFRRFPCISCRGGDYPCICK